jgi:antitoxin component YwqK of YwqJK toxin-antitoxin module
MKLNLKKNIIFCLLIICFKLNGQEIATIFYNQNWEITSVKKATYYRFAFLNSSCDFFEGKYTDFSVKNKKMISSGEYLSNQKNGEFIKYFENGNIEQQGNYKDNDPSGRWYYYYSNGQLKMTIDFNEKDFQFIEYRDSLNNVLLKNGTGKWEAEVIVYGVPTKLTATFKNGKRHGKWNYVAEDGKKILNEVYRNSEFESGYGYDQFGIRMFNQPYFNISYFSEARYNTIEQMVCEKDFDVKFSSLNWVKKILNLKNTQNISYLNSNLPADQILFIDEDSFGNSWIGTGNNGLIKSDSVFTFYNKDNTPIKSNYVSSMQIDNNGKIWFSFKSPNQYPEIKTAGLACLSNNKIVIYNTDNSGLTSNEINDIAVDKNNKKWFATENCIISYDDSTIKWEKHYNKESDIRKVDTVKYKNKDEYLRYAKEINSVTNSWEEKIYQRNNKSYNTQIEPTERHYSTTTYYESPIDFYNIEILPTNEKLINSSRNGCCIYNDMTWECDSSRNNLQYVRTLLTRKFQMEKNDSLVYMNQLSRIMKKNLILQLITGIDNSLWALTNNNIFKITGNRIIEYDLFDKDIKYIQDGDFKSKFYSLYQDKQGGIWACINSAILKIE